jgi:RecJ-like exonuclease
MAYTDINSRAGKGSRLEHNVSTKKYREGWSRIFGKQQSKPRTAVEVDMGIRQCPECEGYGELPVGQRKIKCPACDGEGKVMTSCE